MFLCNIFKQPDLSLIFPLDSLIFLSVTHSHDDLAHASGMHSSLTNKILLVLCVHVAFCC